MRTVLLGLACYGALSTAGMADECDALAARLVATYGLSIERRTEGEVVLMHHPLAHDVSLSCTRPWRTADVWIAANTVYPPEGFFKLASEVGSVVTGASARAIKTASQSCSETGLKAKVSSDIRNWTPGVTENWTPSDVKLLMGQA